MRWYHLRLWHGMDLPAWLGLLRRNRFRVVPRRIPMATTVTILSIGNSVGRLLQGLLFGGRLQTVELEKDPIFIIGHWRSGTTWLHELLAMDNRHKCPDTYECAAPHHCLLTKRYLLRWGGWLLPSTRPMDSMAMGWDRPQEDELALCAMGMDSIYTSWAFPEDRNQGAWCLEAESENDGFDASRWQSVMVRLARQMTYNDGRRLVLKSPTHTARIDQLLEIFPDARFVYLVRDPYDTFCSTLRLWTKMISSHGFQGEMEPTRLETRLLDVGESLFRSFERSRPLLASGRLCTVRFEDLVDDPVSEVERVYRELGLEGFEELVRPELDRRAGGLASIRPAGYPIDAALQARILDRWGPAFSKFGYGAGANRSSRASYGEAAEPGQLSGVSH